MALDDRDIFNAVFTRFKDQPIEYIMEQYALAKKLNMEIERGADTQTAPEACAPVAEPAQEQTEETAAPAPVHKRYTKRDLKIKPQDAITDDTISCCLCGIERQNLTANHMMNAHGLTIDEYKKLCGYPPEQKLMSRRRLAKSREIISKAQEARIRKNALLKNSY